MTGRIAITGISGFIGRHLASYLSNRFDVSGLDKSLVDILGIDVHRADVLKPEELKDVFTDVDVVIHLAGMAYLPDASKSVFTTYDTNAVGTYNVLKAFQDSEAEKFIFASSAKVYGTPKYLPIDEKHPLEPINTYGRSKKLAEDFINAVHRESDKGFIILRQFNVYGPGQGKNFLIPTILNQIKGKDEIELGNVDVKRDFLYVEDLVRAYELMIKKRTNGLDVFNVGSGRSYSVSDVVDTISEVSGKKVTIRVDKGRVRKEHKEERADISKIGKLGWKPKTGLREGIARMIG